MRIGGLNLQQDALVRAYVQHYSGLGNGILPAFEGTMYQEGNGLGDIFRSVFRSVLPILASGATTFFQRAAEGIGHGKGIGTAAADAIAPAVSDLVQKSVHRITQKGKGRRSSRKKHRKSQLPKKRRVYKRKRHVMKSSKHKRRTHKRRKLEAAPINF